MKTIVIIYGPPASGKTLNSAALREHYKCDHVFDAGFDNRKIAEADGRVLVLSSSPQIRGPYGGRRMFMDAITVTISVEEAAIALGERWVVPGKGACQESGEPGVERDALGSAMFFRVMSQADADEDRERGELMRKVWSPTPWMLDVFDGGPGLDGREREIRNWLNRNFGRESSPIHGHEGLWRQGNVTIHGRTWYGFATEEMMTRFAATFGELNTSSELQERTDTKTGIELIAAERERQITAEGWTAEHDDQHVDCELADAAMAYLHQNSEDPIKKSTAPGVWPWESEWWKPSDDPVRNLVKAGALIAAEIDRLNRQKQCRR